MRIRNDSAIGSRIRQPAWLAIAAGLLAATLPPPSVEQVDPFVIADDDFRRHLDPAAWQGLSVERIVFQEEHTTWRVWRIVNTRRIAGPLWVVPHDNEDAAFSAALEAVRSWGGVMMAIDTDAAAGARASRLNRRTGGAPIDPNRNFRASMPLYLGAMLADLGPEPRAIVALHTNAPGFGDPQSSCAGNAAWNSVGGGSGDISISLCTERFHPSPSRRRDWPFDDDDTLSLMPFVPGMNPADAWCGTAMIFADANVVFERVAESDGSLSNYAIQHGLRYVNLETEDRGANGRGVAMARDRLVHMADMVMERCGDLSGASLNLPALADIAAVPRRDASAPAPPPAPPDDDVRHSLRAAAGSASHGNSNN